MKSSLYKRFDKKLLMIFLLTVLASASVISVINWFGITGRVIVKGDPIFKEQPVVKEWEILQKENLSFSNLNLAEVNFRKAGDNSGFILAKFNATNNLSFMIVGMKLNSSLKNAKWNITVENNNNMYLGANLSVLITTININAKNYFATVPEYVMDVYKKSITLKYNKNYDFKVLDFAFCKSTTKVCNLNTITNVSDGCKGWFDLIFITDGPGKDEEIMWKIKINVTS